MFGISHPKDSPELFLNHSINWDEYMADLWHRLFQFCHIPKNGIVIEVGPGTSTKIARALRKISFTGTIHIVEPHPSIGEKIYKSYETVLPKTKLHLHTNPLEKIISELPQKPDAIIGNHVLDDMIILASQYASLNDFNWAHPNSTYISDIKLFKSNWQKLKNDVNELEKCKEMVINTWQNVVQSIHPQFLLLSQYESYFYSQHNFKEIDQHAFDVLIRLKETYRNIAIPKADVQMILNTLKNYNQEHIGNNVLNSDYWLLSRANDSTF